MYKNDRNFILSLQDIEYFEKKKSKEDCRYFEHIGRNWSSRWKFLLHTTNI